MKAAREFLAASDIAHIEGWVVSGASKRGWTTWDVAITRCESCEKVIAVVPLVPIVPDLNAEMHRMWRAYGGFTWTFDPYTRVNLTEWMGTPELKMISEVVDPIVYLDRVKEIPKLIVVTSNDEFMMFDWTNIYYDKLGGETHLLIAPNAEHAMVTNIYDIMTSLTCFTRSISQGHGPESRPSFNYTYNEENGEISVQMLETNKVKPLKVSLRHAETLSSKRRDFRIVFQSNERTEPCKLPFIPMSLHMKA